MILYSELCSRMYEKDDFSIIYVGEIVKVYRK